MRISAGRQQHSHHISKSMAKKKSEEFTVGGPSGGLGLRIHAKGIDGGFFIFARPPFQRGGEGKNLIAMMSIRRLCMAGRFRREPAEKCLIVGPFDARGAAWGEAGGSYMGHSQCGLGKGRCINFSRATSGGGGKRRDLATKTFGQESAGGTLANKKAGPPFQNYIAEVGMERDGILVHS